MLKTVTKKRASATMRAASMLALVGIPSAAGAEEWRMVIAREDAVVLVDADTVKRTGPLLSFHVLIRWQKPDEDGAIGNVGDATFDCVRKLVKTPGLQDVHPDGSRELTKDQKITLEKILPNSLGDLIRDRMCSGKWGKDSMNGVPMEVPPDMAVSSTFGLLALGLESEPASGLATGKYWDPESLDLQLDAYAVPAEKRDAVRKVLAGQTRPAPPPPAPIVPLASAVATGLVGAYRHSEHEMGAEIVLRADGTFRYGLTVGSLDETATGRWSANGKRVKLTSEPRPVAPTITPGPVERKAGIPFSIQVVSPNGNDVPGVDFAIEFDAGDQIESYTPGDVWTLPASETRTPRFVTFSMPSYNLRSARLPIDGRPGQIATFALTPNDFGVVDMTDVAVEADKDGLTMHRAEGSLRFERGDD